MSMKNSNGTIGNPASAIPACIAVPQTTTPPGNPNHKTVVLAVAVNNNSLTSLVRSIEELLE
jgi:hypothetical protein